MIRCALTQRTGNNKLGNFNGRPPAVNRESYPEASVVSRTGAWMNLCARLR